LEAHIMSHRRPLLAFVLLSLVWGSSYLFIKIAVEDLSPLALVSLRLTLGLLLLAPLLVWRRVALPRKGRTWLDLAFAGFVGTALPFTLISWGEQRIDSGLASLLTSTTPLFAVLLADVWQHDRPVTARKVVGLAGGFLGILVLLGNDILDGAILNGATGQLATILAAACYAVSSTYVRKRLSSLPPLTVSFGQLLFAGVFAWCGVLALEAPAMGEVSSLLRISSGPVLLSVVWLGLLGSGLAYVLFNTVLQEWGATRATMVTYLIPVVGLVLGVVILDEALSWRLLVGSLLTISGMVLVNLRPRRPASA
jgi:drug/metabolite transporter (DMT)-like permease